jgi:hypothetical protein
LQAINALPCDFKMPFAYIVSFKNTHFHLTVRLGINLSALRRTFLTWSARFHRCITFNLRKLGFDLCPIFRAD